jgi:hypothetical protein
MGRLAGWLWGLAVGSWRLWVMGVTKGLCYCRLRAAGLLLVEQGCSTSELLC